jgi:hypothetical protein
MLWCELPLCLLTDMRGNISRSSTLLGSLLGAGVFYDFVASVCYMIEWSYSTMLGHLTVIKSEVGCHLRSKLQNLPM